jgi:hypothetical protein
MKRALLLFIILIPIICTSQTQIYGFNMPIELDHDTIYKFDLDEKYCIQDENDIFGGDEHDGCSYSSTFPFLYFYHEFSLNCCTDHFYEIEVKGEDIYISKSDTGEYCTCGNCTYMLSYSDQYPEKNQYHIHMSGLDTIVSKPSNINDIYFMNDIVIDYDGTNDIITVQIINKKDGPVKVKIIALNGSIHLEKIYKQDVFDVSTDVLNPGIYIVRFEINGEYINKKVIIR